MAGGLFLCYEGFEKLAHKALNHGDQTHREELAEALIDPDADLAVIERDKVKGAIRTDFILSAEIVVITLGIVAVSPFLTRVTVLAGIALLMTVAVYGLVAGIVKLDDAGLFLSRVDGGSAWQRFQRGLGRGILRAAPYLMKTLSVVGMIAMFLVGGGILVHGIPVMHHGIEHLGEVVRGLPAAGALLQMLASGLVGVVAGAVTLAVVIGVKRVRAMVG
jgi:predicted DNA repair protein MutK